jgi:hypothetical protein
MGEMKQIKTWTTILLVFSLCFCLIAAATAIVQLVRGRPDTIFSSYLVPALIGVYAGLALKGVQCKLKELEEQISKNKTNQYSKPDAGDERKSNVVSTR